MGVEQDSDGANLIVQVLIDSVGLSKVFTYLVPTKFEDIVSVGNFVSVPLGASRAKGWIVGVAKVSASFAHDVDYELLPLYRVLGGGPSKEVISLCNWAAWRFIGSPVSFLTHASPKKRIDANLVDQSDFEFDFDSCGRRFILNQNMADVIRIPPSFSRLNWLSDHFGAHEEFVGRALIVCPTQRMVDEVYREFTNREFYVARYPDEVFGLKADAQIVVGARNAVFASVSGLGELIVVDADESSHKESSSPYWESSIVAKARASDELRVILLSSTPSTEMCHDAKIMSLSRVQERDGWPMLMVANLCDEQHNGALISSSLISQIRLALEHSAPSDKSFDSEDFDGVLVLYNRLGGARTLVCAKCKNPVVCVNCSTTLMQTSNVVRNGLLSEPRDIIRRAKESIAVNELICPNCKHEYPAICTNCLSNTLKVVTFGIKRFSLLLQTALKLPVQEVDASSSGAINPKARVIVGTEAMFSRFRSAKMVVIADFDHYLFAPTLDATEKALSLLAKASRLVPPRSVNTGYVPLYVQTRDPASSVLKSAVEGDPKRVISEELELRRQLGLPPFGAIVRVSGKSANLWVEKSGLSTNTELQIIRLSDQEMDLRLDSKEELLEMVAKARSLVSAKSVKFVADPV